MTVRLGEYLSLSESLPWPYNKTYEPQHEKPTFWFQTRSDTNRAAQPLELIRGLLEISELGSRGLY